MYAADMGCASSPKNSPGGNDTDHTAESLRMNPAYPIPNVFRLMLALSLAILLAAPQARAAKNEHRDVVYAQGYVAPTAESTEYQKKDLLLDALLPSGDGPHPALVVVHGGSFQNGD